MYNPFAVVTCDLPTPVDHATVTPNDAEHDYDTSITYTCDLSYNNTSGDLVRTCQADGQWSGDAPVCTGEYQRFIRSPQAYQWSR